MTSRIAAGFTVVMYGLLDEDNKFIGSGTTAPAAGDQDGSGMTRLIGARTFDPTIAESEVLTVTGDDEPLTTFDFDPEALPEGVLAMAVKNWEFEALCQGTNAVTIGNVTGGVLNPRDRSRVPMCYLFQRRAKNWEPGSRGAAAWEALFAPSVITKPLGNALEQRTFSEYNYSLNTSHSDRILWSTVNQALWGTSSAPLFPFATDNPLTVKRFTGNNSQQNFNLDYDIISDTRIYVYVNDILQTLTTDYTASGDVLSFVAAPASAAEIVVLQEFAEENLRG